MNRRSLFMAAPGAIFGVPLIGRVMAAPIATPETGREHKPQPITLAQGLTLVDYRFGYAYGHRDAGIEFLGEIASTATIAIRPPDVVLSFHDANDNIVAESHAFSVLDVMQPKQPDYLRAEWTVDEFDPFKTPWSTLICSLPDSWSIQSQSQLLGDDQTQFLSIADVGSTSEANSWVAHGNVINKGDHPIKQVQVFGIFRDAANRYAGYTWTSIESSIPRGKEARFKLDAGVNTMVPVNPFQFTAGKDYHVDLVLQGGVAG